MSGFSHWVERSPALGVSVHGYRRGVHNGIYAELLGSANGDPQRICRRRVDWVDQLRRRPRRIRGSLSYRLSPDPDQPVHARADLPPRSHGPPWHAVPPPPRPTNPPLKPPPPSP